MMKKLALLLLAAATMQTATAQLNLTGTSYVQDFDNIGTGLPTGWEVDSAATATYKGYSIAFDANTTAWNLTPGKYKNFAAKNGFTSYAGTPAATQNAANNRALGIRQVGAIDSGAAFTLEIANTTGLTNFMLSFKLMSLDSLSPRVTTWRVDYATGANPTSFTDAGATGTLTTGGYTFSENTINVNFGAALNNQSGPVYIRIAALSKTTGSGTRASSAIDDFNLTWTGSGAPVYNPQVVTKSPTGANVPVASNLSVTFDRLVQKGTGNFYVKNETDQTTQTIDVTNAAVTVAANVATVSGVTLALGKSYHVTFDSTAFDTAGYKCTGIYDTTAWTFSTPPVPLPALTSLNEDFNTSCGGTPANLPSGWSKYSVTGSQQWNCTAYGYNSTAAVSMNGYQTTNNVNEDWLITPQLDLSAMTNPNIAFRAFKKFTGDDLHIMVSNDYAGFGAPSTATWTDLNVNFASVDTNWNIFSGNLNSYKAQLMYVAFKYTSTASDGAQWKIDDVQTTSAAGINNVSKASLSFQVLGHATASNMTIGYNLAKGSYNVTIVDLSGRAAFTTALQTNGGRQTTTFNGLNLAPGMYLVRIDNGSGFGVAKVIIE